MPGELNPYEGTEWAALPGCVMHPGGLALTERLLSRSGLTPPAEILDLGCGSGEAVNLLRKLGFPAMGLDQSPLLLRRAREVFPGLKLVQGDADTLPFPDASFHGILAECVLSCTDAGAVLPECRRILRPGGVLMLSDLCLRAAEPGTEANASLLTKAAWTDTLAEHGFAVFSITDEGPALTEFVLAFLWNGGSMDSLCRGAAGRRHGEKLGYFALTAVKKD